MEGQTIVNIPDDKRKVKGVADIVIAIDVTGSMEPCITGLKDNLKVFVDNLSTGTGDNQQSLTWRARMLPFRDLNVDEVGLDNSFPFVSTANEFQAQIDTLEHKGGGDEPESILDALYVAAQKTDWKEIGQAHRFILLFTDAHPHDELHSSTIEVGADNSINAVIQEISKQRIKLFIVAPAHDHFSKLAMIQKSMYLVLKEEDRHKGLENTDFTKLMESLAKTVSQQSEIVVA